MYELNDLRGYTPATIRSAFNHSAEIAYEYGDLGNVNATSIITKIIHEAGRLNERYASDILYGLDKIRTLSEGKHIRLDSDAGFDEIITFGIREDGVDHNSYIMSSLLETRHLPTGYVFPKQKYRKILAVRLRAWMDGHYHCARADFSIRDVTNAFHKLDPADLKHEGYSIKDMPFEDRINPEPTEPKDRIDGVQIEKLKSEGYKSFGCREIPGEILRSEGCDDNIECIEIDGFRDPAVPAPKDPCADAVARVYVASGMPVSCAVCWIQPEYAHYGAAMAQVEKARNTLLGILDEPDPGQPPAQEA